MSDNTELKRLAESATPEEWVFEKAANGSLHVVCGEFTDIAEVGVVRGPDPEADARYIVAAQPYVVLALIAENDHLAMCARQWEEAAMQWGAERDQIKSENIRLRQENEILRAGRPVHLKAFYKFPEKLLKIRLEKGLSQRQLSALAGMSCPAISNYETGVTTPRMKNVLRLEAALDCPGAFQGDSNE